MELDPQVSPEEIMSREVELGCESWTSFASGCSSTAVQQRTLSFVLAAVHGLSVLFRAVSAVEPSHSPPPPPPPPSLINSLASVDVKQNGPVVLQHRAKTAGVSAPSGRVVK